LWAAAAAGLLGAGLLAAWLFGAFSAPEGLSPWSATVVWILEQQSRFHRALAGHLSTLRAVEGPAAMVASAALIGASFLYGLFHAAGPGHGKAVIATYLLTQPHQLRRGVALATAAAFCQGFVAFLLVYGLVGLGGLLPRESGAAVLWSERLSFTLVILLGLWLLAAALHGAWRRHARATAHPHDHAHDGGGHGHTDDHAHDHAGHHDACCAHGPSLDQLAAPRNDWRSNLGIVLSIGLRPCSGALIVLVFAHSAALDAAGIAALFALSAGTALATSLLAAFTVFARDKAARLAARSHGGATERVARLGLLVRALGGALILALGISLLSASFAPVHPLGLG
jgi:ABC-type nickel/cobalt efflux system permease component RcnA